ncbi:hypothetical protein BDD12DRAFT_812680 [Trichophaea hybrida]|nr:hypothetical protein BDD12DRAFT_812680 [Trichophaea hybrida]
MERRIIHCTRNLLETKGQEKTVQIMHQTVRELFLQPDRLAATSRFRMTQDDSHIRITITCTRYLISCATCTEYTTTWGGELPEVEP